MPEDHTDKIDKIRARRKTKKELEIQDIGCVLAGLLKEKQNPKALVKKYLTQDLQKFGGTTSKKLSDLRTLPKLCFVGGDAIKVGGSGIVFQVTNEKVPSVKYALKITRPSLYQDWDAAGKVHLLSQKEFIHHAPLVHENIARLYGVGSTYLEHVRGLPYKIEPILLEWVENAQPLNKYLLNTKVDYQDIINIIIQCFMGLNHLHLNNLIHWDIKSDNILINNLGVAKLVDIGNARSLQDKHRGLEALSTKDNLPPSLLESQPAATGSDNSSQRTIVTLPDSSGLSWDCFWLDMWMLARDLNELFGADDQAAGLRKADSETSSQYLDVMLGNRKLFLHQKFPENSVEAQFALKFIRLILKRLLHPQKPTDSHFYDKAIEVAQDLRKLEPEFGAAQSVTELSAIPQKVLRMPVSGNSPFTPRVNNFFNSRLVQRLSQHLQLGSIANLYPGATHCRSEHVAGVLSTVCQYVRALYADRTLPFWRLSIQARDIDALLVAALVHDIGHLAFGHSLEEMAGLFRGRTHEDYAIWLLKTDHVYQSEKGSASLSNAQATMKQDRDLLINLLKTDWVGDDERKIDEFLILVAEILRPKRNCDAVSYKDAENLREDSEILKLQILHSIIDSAIDADKMDYLFRDAHHCGVEYAKGIDADRFFQSLTAFHHLPPKDRAEQIVPGRPTPPLQACIGVTDKGILPVESILIARYQMFRSVYWHRTARAYAAMLQFLVMEYVSPGRKKVERLDELIIKFRENSDGKALEWLKKELLGSSFNMSKSRKDILARVISSFLGERDQLYKEVFVIRYERERSDDIQEIWSDDIQETRAVGRKASIAKMMYLKFMKQSQELNAATRPREYLDGVKNFRNTVTRELNKKLPGGINIKDGEILIDIPPAGKDQIDNVFVYQDDKPKPIHELSPSADAVRENFLYWTRNVRVFMSPDAVGRCRKKGLQRDAIHKLLWSVFMDIFKVEPQLKIPF